MNPISTCPEAQELELLLSGKLAAAQVEELTQHVEKCGHCAETVEKLLASDTLAGQVRAGAAAAAELSEGSLVALVERLKKLRPKPTQHSADTGDPALAEPSGASMDKAAAFLAPPQAPDEIGRLGPYRVLKVLGSGGMGVVFLAEDPQLKRQVALKAMKPALAASDKARQRFLREAQAAAAIKHDHIVTIHQVGEDRGVPYLAIELLEGEALDTRLKRDQILPMPEVLRIGRQIALGLAAAHDKGLIHRDIKPGNIWLEGNDECKMMNDERKTTSPQPSADSPHSSFIIHHSSFRRVKILDFGLARAADAEGPQLTQSGAIVGTPAYMAPEQGRSEAIDNRCDLFSLGCVLYRMCTGQIPFKGPDTISTLLAVASDQPKPPVEVNPEVPQALSELVMQLLAKKPEERPPSARAVVEALAAMERDVTAIGHRPSAFGQPAAGSLQPIAGSRWPTAGSRKPIAVAAAAVFFLAILLAGVIFTIRTRHGTLTVTTAEADVKILIDGEEKITIDSKKVGKIELVPGEHKLTVKRGGEELFTDNFTLKSGGETVIDARWEPKLAKKEGKTEPIIPILPGAKASPLDLLDPAKIPPSERFDWQPKELVAVLGEHRQRHWDLISGLAYLNFRRFGRGWKGFIV